MISIYCIVVLAEGGGGIYKPDLVASNPLRAVTADPIFNDTLHPIISNAKENNIADGANPNGQGRREENGSHTMHAGQLLDL